MTTPKVKTVRYAMPSGAWVDVRDLNGLTRAERRDLRIKAAEYSADIARTNAREIVEAQAAMEDALIYPAMIVAWSYKASLPPTSEVLDAVFNSRAADEMALAGLAKEWFNSLYPSFSPKVISSNGQGEVLDPKALTSPSSP
jgi:hypothetical protein